jgi:two-component system, chemotaxis family, chemotaxis protein CheY
MQTQPTTILIVDPDAAARANLANQLRAPGTIVLDAVDAANALRVVAAGGINLLITELYLPVDGDECLIHAVRRNRSFRHTRIVAHTHRSMTADREWAMRAGADAYLIKPTRAQRMRYVVMRLATGRGPSVAATPTSSSPMGRRDSLDTALNEIEHGTLSDTSAIVFSRAWWEQLTPAQRRAFRGRAKASRVSLRSDSMLSNHFVEVRGRSRDEVGLSTERPESPYRR